MVQPTDEATNEAPEEVAEGAVTVEETEAVEAVALPFAEVLQGAVTRFSSDVGALRAADVDVDTARGATGAAAIQLAAAEQTETDKLRDRNTVAASAVASRDELVRVLQSWVPS